MSAKLNLMGQKFGRLLVLKEEGKTKFKCVTWLCKCECGNEVVVIGRSLKNRSTQSCGCIQSEIARANARKRNFKHGLSYSKEYRIWAGIRERCTNSVGKDWKNYGERGIKICDRWLNSPENFLMDMGACPSEKNSIDRINNDKGYEPENCRWATAKEQGRNKRGNRLITFNGKTKTLSEWAEITGISSDLIRQRLCNLGWSTEEALSTPAGSKKQVITSSG